jgi:hypothetical protein
MSLASLSWTENYKLQQIRIKIQLIPSVLANNPADWGSCWQHCPLASSRSCSLKQELIMMCSCNVRIPSCRKTAFIQGPLIAYTWERISHGVLVQEFYLLLQNLILLHGLSSLHFAGSPPNCFFLPSLLLKVFVVVSNHWAVDPIPSK